MSHPEFPTITLRIGVFRIGKVAGILPPIALDLLSALVSLFGALTCRNWDKKYGASVDELEAQLGSSEVELGAAQTEMDDAEATKLNLTKALAKLEKGAEEYDAMKGKLEESTRKYDQAKEKYDQVKEVYEKTKEKLAKRKRGSTTTKTIAVEDKGSKESIDAVDASSAVASTEEAEIAGTTNADAPAAATTADERL